MNSAWTFGIATVVRSNVGKGGEGGGNLILVCLGSTCRNDLWTNQ